MHKENNVRRFKKYEKEIILTKDIKKRFNWLSIKIGAPKRNNFV